MLERLRPHPHRGDVIAAGVVVLTLFAVVLDGRFADTWGDAPRFVVLAAIAAVVGAMAVQSELEETRPRPFQSILFVATFILAALALGALAQTLGADEAGSSGALVWTGLILVGLAAWFAGRRNSAIMTLLAAATGVLVVNAFVDWVFDPDGSSTFRWLLLLCALALTAAAVAQRDARRRHAVSLVDTVGLTMLALGALTLLDDLLGSFIAFGGTGGGAPAGWELVLFAFGCGLIAYGAVDRERVPQFLGVAVLAEFAAAAAQPGRDGASLVGWPLFLLLAAAALLALGLRPREELPPEPPVPPSAPPPADGDPPTAPTVVAEP